MSRTTGRGPGATRQRMEREAAAAAAASEGDPVADTSATMSTRPEEHHSPPTRKRKAQNGLEASTNGADGSSKKKARQQNEPARKRDISHDESIAMKDSALLGDLFAQKIGKHYSNSTVLEQHDISIPKHWIQDTTDFDHPHVTANLPAFLEKFVGNKDMLASNDVNGSPKVVVVSSSGIRVADVVRDLKDFNQPLSKVAKLFPKHMKFQENIDYLAKTQVGIAVVTPTRLKDLIEKEALKLTDLKAIVIDASYQDVKKRSLMDMSDLFRPLMELLRDARVRERLEAEMTRLLVF
jgi:protein CMS1